MGTLLGNKDQCLFDSVAQEVNKLAGTSGYIFQFEQIKSQIDPLYGEPIETEYKKNDEGKEGIEIPLFFRSPDRTPMTGEEGFRLDRNSHVFIAKKDLDDRGLRRPRNGDILYVWGKYYDVIDSSYSEGYINDNPDGVSSIDVEVMRRTKAPPEGLWIRDKQI